MKMVIDFCHFLRGIILIIIRGGVTLHLNNNFYNKKKTIIIMEVCSSKSESTKSHCYVRARKLNTARLVARSLGSFSHLSSC